MQRTTEPDRQFCDDCKRPLARDYEEWRSGFPPATATHGDYCGLDLPRTECNDTNLLEANCYQAAWSNALTAERNTREILNELHGYVADLCKLLGSDPDQVPCDIWHLRDLILRQQGQLGRLRLVERALIKLDSVLGVRVSFMHEGKHWKENPIDPISVVLLATKLNFLSDGEGSEFVQKLRAEAEARLRAACRVPPAERCGICQGSGSVTRYVMPDVPAPTECKSCSGSGRRPA